MPTVHTLKKTIANSIVNESHASAPCDLKTVKKKDMENHERVRELLEQCCRVATLVEYFAWLQRCDECIEQLEELCRAKRPRLAVGHRQSMVARIARLASAKVQLEQRFMHIGGDYASGEYASIATKDLSSGERSTPRLKTVYRQVL